MNVVFPCCANWETFVADTKCFWTKSETFFILSTTNVARSGKRGNICVRNNVSSFARAFYINTLTWLRGFQQKLYLEVFSALFPTLFWEMKDKRNCYSYLKASEP